MSAQTLKRFGNQVKKYRKAHPGASFKSAQKAVSRANRNKPGKKKKHKAATKKKARKKVSGVRTVSKSHVDKNRFKNVDIQIGSVSTLKSALKKRLMHDYGKAQGQLLIAKKAASKKKATKRIKNIRSELRRLA
jgi:hypothetical protein